MVSRLASEALPVEVISASGRSVVHVHRAVLDDIPFFSSQRQRWSRPDGPLKVELPASADINDLDLILAKTYWPSAPVPPLSMAQALRAVEVASMLNCSAEVLGKFIVAVQKALRTEEDAAALRELCEARDMPEDLSKLAAKRRKTDIAGPSEKELRKMFQDAVERMNPALLNIAGRLLGQHSRQGEKALVQVQQILCIKTSAPASATRFPLVLEFLKTHPRFYATMSQSLLIRSPPVWISSTGEAFGALVKFCIDFMNLGVESFLAGKLNLNDLLAFFQAVITYNGYIYENMLLVEIVPALTDVLQRVSREVQSQICKILVNVEVVSSGSRNKHFEDKYFVAFAKPDLISKLALDVKSVFNLRILDLDACFFKDFATAEFLDSLPLDMKSKAVERIIAMQEKHLSILTVATVQALGKQARLRLCAQAYALKTDVREAMLAIVEEETDGKDDSIF